MKALTIRAKVQRRRLGWVGVGAQMRRVVRAHACCPRHNEPFCVLLASPCALYQHVQLLRCSAAPLQLASSFFAAVANVRAQMMMVKQGGSETADNVGSKLVNVAHSRCQQSLPGRSCYPARRRHYPARGSRDDETWFNMRPHQCPKLVPFHKSTDGLIL